jgi:hypothetical protein
MLKNAAVQLNTLPFSLFYRFITYSLLFMKSFSLDRTSSFDLKEGDYFIMRGVSHHVYHVYLITEKYVHAMETVNERSIRLNSKQSCLVPDYVYLMNENTPDRRYNSNGDEARFMING